MAFEPVPLHRLERGYLRVLRLRAVIGWLVLAPLAVLGDGYLSWRTSLPVGIVAGPILIFAVVSIVFLVPRRWSRWGYAFTERELHVAHGWLTRVHTVVPVSRVQHIDVSQGPIERGSGVATLSLHTAGTENSLVVLPGITRQRAEDIRDAIRVRISDAPW